MVPRLLTIQELSEWLKIPRGTLYNWVSEGRIPRVKLGGKLRFDPREIERWLEANTIRERGPLPGLDRILAGKPRPGKVKEGASIKGR